MRCKSIDYIAFFVLGVEIGVELFIIVILVLNLEDMLNSVDTPRVFISYSWKPNNNKLKTIELAERLRLDGVDVVIDEWDLSHGQDKYHFMEQMVNDSNIKRVLLICNKEYSEKANNKAGGVGIESLIISDEIYTKADQTKFIPIVFERNLEGKEFIPIFIKSRIYIDLSSDEIYELQYEELLRNIFEKPASRRPPLGSPPQYIQKEEQVFLRTAHKVKTIENAFINEKKNSQVFVDLYYNTFIEALEDFEIDIKLIPDPTKVDETVLEKIDKLIILRDDFINFLEVIFTYDYDFNIEKFISFFEKLLHFQEEQDWGKYTNQSLGYYQYDQYRFFFYEIFLYLTAIMLTKEKYKELAELLNHEFLIFDTYGQTKIYSFSVFKLTAESLDVHRNNRLQLSRASVTADLIKARSNNSKYTFEQLKECDVLLYYISVMNHEPDTHKYWYGWLPQTSVYEVHSISILNKMISLKYFDKVKPIFNVSNVGELKIKVLETSKRLENLRKYSYRFPQLINAFDFEKIGTRK